jgi:hypothetical protein
MSTKESPVEAAEKKYRLVLNYADKGQIINKALESSRPIFVVLPNSKSTDFGNVYALNGEKELRNMESPAVKRWTSSVKSESSIWTGNLAGFFHSLVNTSIDASKKVSTLLDIAEKISNYVSPAGNNLLGMSVVVYESPVNGFTTIAAEDFLARVTDYLKMAIIAASRQSDIRNGILTDSDRPADSEPMVAQAVDEYTDTI